MPEANLDPKIPSTPEELFALAQPLLDQVVRNALHHYKREYTAYDVGRFKQRLKLMLWEGAQNLLGDLLDEAKLKPWLQQVANHVVIRVLKEESRKVSFDDAPPEVLIQSSTQEEELLQKEQEQLLKEAIAKLTPRERKLVELMRQGLSAKEIARRLGIRVKTFYARKSEALKKLKELVEERKN